MKYKILLNQILDGQDLTFEQVSSVMDQIMTGKLSDAQIGAFLAGMRAKGETIDEIAAAASIMRKHATPIGTGGNSTVDTCGTGGDGAHTFNISTTAAFVAAGAGVYIAKHGNRSVSSKSGSADVLAALGVNIQMPVEEVSKAVQKIGIGFLFAPALHGAMKYAIGPRKELGVRTIFNLLGPLTNPAGAEAQVLGVYDKSLTKTHCTVLQKLGSRAAMVVHGLDGLDEITCTSNTQVSELKDGKVNTYEFDPRPYIGKYYDASELTGGDAEANAQITQNILAGTGTAAQEAIVILNAAATIYVAELAETYEQAYKLAKESIESGNAYAKLDSLRTFA
ncbi:MAG: anthranilate phosphoribosyltransferase [Lentisphaeria bacterium]|nr:anthranilate phosphoribosyltransferase [Lentisphaeria bacterium]